MKVLIFPIKLSGKLRILYHTLVKVKTPRNKTERILKIKIERLGGMEHNR